MHEGNNEIEVEKAHNWMMPTIKYEKKKCNENEISLFWCVGNDFIIHLMSFYWFVVCSKMIIIFRSLKIVDYRELPLEMINISYISEI